MNAVHNAIAHWYANQTSFLWDDHYRSLVATVEALVAESVGPKPWCPDCGHSLLAVHPIIGCQHLTAVYDEHRLLHHDKCRCKTGMPETTP